MEEFLDIVDEKDEVVGRASHSDIYAHNYPHRIVHVIIFDSSQRMALQKRSLTKNFCPGRWSTAVGGHVQNGEKYVQAAKREFMEELGVNTDLKYVGYDLYHDGQGPKKWLTTFRTIYEGEYNLNPEEVQEIKYFSIDELRNITKNPEHFHPELLFLLEKYYL